MKLCVLSIFIILLTRCSLFGREESCSSSPSSEGWQRTKKPAGIDLSVPWYSSEYFIWFRNNEGLVRACRRDVSYRCLEESSTYKNQDGQWVKFGQGEIIVCT